MSERITQSDWTGVYYDRQAEGFFTIRAEETSVTLMNAFTGDDYETLPNDEFRDIVRTDDLDEVSARVVDRPAEYLQDVLIDAADAISGDASSLLARNPVEYDFAMQATTITHDKPHYMILPDIRDMN